MRWRADLDHDDGNPRTSFASDLRRLLEARVQSDVTNADFASRAGISPSSLSAAVGGKSVPTVQVLSSIMSAAGLAGDESVEWLNKREAVASTFTADGVDARAATDAKALVSLRFRQWDQARPGDPDYRLNTRLLTREELILSFRPAIAGSFSPSETAYLAGSAVYWGVRYLRWTEVAEFSPELAEVLVDNVVGPFRRQRWRSAWLLEKYPVELRSRAVGLIESIWRQSLADSEFARLQPILGAISQAGVERLLSASTDPDLDEHQIKRSLLNEFPFETSKLGARGLLAAGS